MHEPERVTNTPMQLIATAYLEEDGDVSEESGALRDLADAMDQHDAVRAYVGEWKDGITVSGHLDECKVGDVEVAWNLARACDAYEETRSLVSELVDDRIGVLLGDAARVAADRVVDAQCILSAAAHGLKEDEEDIVEA